MARIGIFALLALLVCSASAWAAPLANPSFEDGLDQWTETGEAGTFAAVDTPAPASDGSLYAKADLETEKTALQSWLTQEFTIPGDANYIGVDMGYTIVNPGDFGTGNGVSAVLRDTDTGDELDLMLLSNALPGDLAGYWRVYVTDVSSFQGKDVELEFSVWAAPMYNSQEFRADNVRFMTPSEAAAALAPEPATLALVALPALTLLRRRRRP